MKYARYIIWNAVILISILFSSSKVFGQTDLELKQHLINGVSSFEENMNEDAANSFSNGSTLENYEDIAAYNLGRSLMETEDLEGAASAFKQAIASSENKDIISNAWYNSGNIALKSNDPSTAVEAYKSALRVKPDFENARHNLAIANKMLQQQEEQQEQDGDEKQDGDEEQDGDEKQDGDEEQEGDKEKEDDEEQDGDKENDEGEQDDKGEDEKEGEQEKQVAGQISKEEMARILESLDQEEERILTKLRKQKGDGKKRTIEKPW
tara:strand:+ start:1956 stop:2753 length:798 start_codon:yes stop_codon:yes gene_type:complete